MTIDSNNKAKLMKSQTYKHFYPVVRC